MRAGLPAEQRSSEKGDGMLKAVGCGVVALGLASLAAPGVAQAAEEFANPPLEGAAAGAQSAGGREALQLTLYGAAVDYLKQTAKVDQPQGSTVEPEEQESSATSLGLLGSSFGVGVGYAWDQVLLGARMQLSSTTRSPAGGGESKVSSIGFLPRVEVIFGSDSTRPYLAGLFAVEHASVSAEAGSSSNAGGGSVITKTEDSSTRFGVGAAFGIHAFLNPSVSIDPEISVVPSWGAGTAKASTALDESTVDYSLNTLRIMVSVGLSAWIDTNGAPPPPPPRESPSAPAPVAAAPAIVEPSAAPLSADIHLPNHRKLYLQVLKEPAQPYLLARLTEPRDRFALSKCEDVSIVESASLTKLAIRTHGGHYLTGRLPVRGAEVLAGIVESNISVCGEQWLLGQESREQVQVFLKARRQLIDDSSSDSDAAETETSPVQLEVAAPAGAPSDAPNAAPSPPVAPNAATAPNAAPSPPTNAFPAPSAPSAQPSGKAATPKK